MEFSHTLVVKHTVGVGTLRLKKTSCPSNILQGSYRLLPGVNSWLVLQDETQVEQIGKKRLTLNPLNFLLEEALF